MEFIILFRANEGASLQMLGSGSQGAADQRRAIKLYGGKVLRQRAVLGRYDAVLLVAFKSMHDCLAYCLAANASGDYAEALPAFKPEDVDIARNRAREVTKELLAAERPRARRPRKRGQP